MSEEKFKSMRNDDEIPESVKQRAENPMGINFKGQMPPQMKAALKSVRGEGSPVTQARPQGSAELEALISGVNSTYVYSEVKLPSKGIFYDGKDGPADGTLHIREMTGDEEMILATPRYVRKGVAINMIFQRCLKQHFKTEELLSIDRTYLLIYLRGLSYGHEYEVEVKCPSCDRKFKTVLNLAALPVNDCPPNFGLPLTGTLPKSGYKFNYRLSRGKDENTVQEHRDRHIKMFGDTGSDDSLHFRTAVLLDDIEGLKDKNELVMLLKKLPIQDVGYLRNTINDPPFGVDTKCEINCPSCLHDFEVELPLEANFFFPKQKQTQEE